jgi:hypothetical protein
MKLSSASAAYTTIGLLYTTFDFTRNSNKALAFVSTAPNVKREASPSSCLFLFPNVKLSSAAYTTIGLLYTALGLNSNINNKALTFTAPRRTGKVSTAPNVKLEASPSPCLFLPPESEPISTEADLRKGDVAIFSALSDPLSRAIAKITGSGFSHSTMVYHNTSEIIEEGSNFGVAINPVRERFYNRTVWIRRLKVSKSNNNGSMDPVMLAADRFMENSPYAAIFRHFAQPEGKLYGVMLWTLEYVTAELVNVSNDKRHAGQTHMVCSEFVYECFKEAGDDYKLQIPDLQPENGTVLNHMTSKVKANPEAYNTKSNANERILTFLRNVWNKLRNNKPPFEDD